ncbi:CheR family methyltransferase [Pseudomonas wadenswilerensis]
MSIERRFFRFLQERIGLDVASVGEQMVERALRQRCAALEAANLDDYWLRLQQSHVEQQALIEAVIVPETWFFRYPESFSALVELARKRQVELGGVRALRVLSLPCSTGEEPYSIAMALLDAGLLPHAFRVDAMDISPNSIGRAEHAVYGRNSFRGPEQAFRERHFSEGEDGHRLDERVRKQVQFTVGNVLDPALLVREGSYDFVFCRNLLIYFDLPTQQRVFEVLKNLTHADGVLFIGPAEGSLLARMGMRPLGIAQSFAYVRQVPEERPAVHKVVAPVPPAPRPAITPPAPAPRRMITPIAPPASRAPTTPARGDQAGELLAQIAVLANGGNSSEARAACQRYLKQFEPSAQVFYWLGLLSDTAGDSADAISQYRKALYLEPQHPEALAHLAALLASQGDTVGARRLQERAARREREADR